MQPLQIPIPAGHIPAWMLSSPKCLCFNRMQLGMEFFLLFVIKGRQPVIHHPENVDVLDIHAAFATKPLRQLR